MREPIYDYDPARALESPEAIALFVADALETQDSVYIANALVVATRANEARASMEDRRLGDFL
jgi:DNA-binding phage protein